MVKKGMKTKAQKIKALREKYGWSQQTIADFLEISQPMYSQYEHGNRNIKDEHIEKLCNLYCLTQEEFLKSDIQTILTKKWRISGL